MKRLVTRKLADIKDEPAARAAIRNILAENFLAEEKIETEVTTWPARPQAAGDHVLRFDCAGKTDASQGYSLGFDALMTRALVYTRPPGFDLRKIQVQK